MQDVQAKKPYRMFARAVDENGELPLERVVVLMQKLMSHLDLDSVLVEIIDTAQSLLDPPCVERSQSRSGRRLMPPARSAR